MHFNLPLLGLASLGLNILTVQSAALPNAGLARRAEEYTSDAGEVALEKRHKYTVDDDEVALEKRHKYTVDKDEAALEKRH
ncbi:hypothetical protein BO78DRAFT_422359, partial [Aspergillus sclerotiicarbonarius CBS 121057]